MPTRVYRIKEVMGNKQEYVQWFRGAAPYIKAHRKKTFVILISDGFTEYSDVGI